MHHSKMCGGHKVAWILLLIGGLNWGLVGIFNLDLVEMLLGGMPWLAKLVYILVGVSALMMLFVGKCCGSKGGCKGCGDGECVGGKCVPKGSDMPKDGGESKM